MQMTEPIRVMHVVLSLDVGGLERIVDDLVRTADKAHLVPSVCCVERPGHLAEQLRGYGVEVVSLNKGQGIRAKGFIRMIKTLRRARPHVVHTHQIGALFYAGPAARLARVPVVVHTEHGRHFAGNRRMRILGRLGVHYADRIYTVSDDIAEEAFRLNVYSTASTCTVINGIDTERFARPTDVSELRKRLGLTDADVVIGTVARLSPVKDQKTLIAAFEILHRSSPGARLVLVGEGPSRAELEAAVSTAGLTECVHFAGRQDDVLPYLNLFDVFVLSSRSEGIPLVILEAMAAGVPVLSTAVGGVPEIITDGETGVLVPPADADSLATALIELVQNRTRRRKLGRAGQELVRREYSLSRMAQTYLDEYRRLLKLKRPSFGKAGETDRAGEVSS